MWFNELINQSVAFSFIQATVLSYRSHGKLFTKIFTPTPLCRHRVAHRAAHQPEPCEICRVVKILRSENVSDDEVVGKAGDGFLRGGRLRGPSGFLATHFVVGPVPTLALLATVVHQLARALLTLGTTQICPRPAHRAVLVQRALHVCRGITFRGSIGTM
jgi:hypothetical protein